MIRAKVCLAADAVIRDAETNNMSVFSIVEGIRPAGLPTLLARMSYFVLWERENTDPNHARGEFTVRIGNNVLNTTPVQLDFGDASRNRTVVNLNGLIVPQPGTCRLRIELEGGAHAEYSFEIEPPQVPVAVAGGGPA